MLQLMERLDTSGLSGLMPALLEHLSTTAGAIGVRLLIADIEARRLETREGLQAGASPRSQLIEIEDSVHGAVYADGRPALSTIEGHAVAIVPMNARHERQGVLEVTLGGDTRTEVPEEVESVGVLFGYLVTAGDLWTDEFHLARRVREMSLAAEIQWSLLPLAAFESPEISIAGALEPAYEVGGDAFDYACGPRTLTLGVFDSMGHGLTAARLSSLCVAAFRNARRAGRSIEEQADRIHQTLLPAFDDEGYSTGVIFSIDLRSPGETMVINGGHERPFLQRDEGSAELIELVADIPFGMPFATSRHAQPFPLQPGDRLTLFTDGVIEAQPDGGEMFGLDALARLLEEFRGDPPRETSRRVTQAARDHRAANLKDDATVVIVDIPG